MKTVQTSFPVFEANQVLSNLHLNQMFDYLSEQERLTRANLIGTGIACGLTLRLDAATATLHLAAGCGVTTEGYLVVEADNVALKSYREFTLPLDVDYKVLRDTGQPGAPAYPMWELFPDGEADVTPLGSPAAFLDNKAVLLFVELKKAGLRTCSPNDCNDRGSQMTVTIRRLLIGVADLAKVIAASADLNAGMTLADIEAAMLGRLNLPDLRLPRYDVPNTSPASSEQVLAGFHAVFRDAQLARLTGDALGAAYLAFRPLLQERYPANPFDGFNAKYSFLDTAYGKNEQIYFLQYYYDLFDDLLRAYDEMRWKGVELLCACVPSELLFPRHLMLGIPRPVGVANPGLYRNGFTPACAGEALRDEFLMLFRRLVDMLDSFTHQPPLPPPVKNGEGDSQIRITPGRYGNAPLEHRAIPYYYRFTATAPLYQVWSPARSRRGRANQCLAYRSSEYSPPAPAFVAAPLRYDLEPYNFLGVEGHLGKQVDKVLLTLLTLKAKYRLPIDIVALRTGAFDENAQLPASDAARFPELETMYDVQREHLLAQLCESIRYLYDVPAATKMQAGASKHPVLQPRSPGYAHAANSLGAWYEEYLQQFLNSTYPDVNQGQIDQQQIQAVYAVLISGKQGLTEAFYPHVVLVYYMTALALALPAALDGLNFPDVENKCQDLRALTRYFRTQESATVHTDLRRFVPQEDLLDHFDQILVGSTLDAIKALHGKYLRRMREVKQMQVLGYFLRQHPGIAHKAGVTVGGTFIVVYHEQLLRRTGNPRTRDGTIARALDRIAGDTRLARDPDVQALINRLNADDTAPAAAGADEALVAAVAALERGTVIADFFLPYRCAGNGPCIEYVLPLPPLGLSVSLGCTDAENSALATLTPAGGVAPIVYQLDGQPFKALTGPVQLGVGEHTLAIRDSAGAQSAPQSVNVPSPLRIGREEYIDDAATRTYRVGFKVSGGTPPYAATPDGLDGDSYISDPVPGGQPIKVEIRDAAGCETSREFTHEVIVCDLPCGGIAQRGGHRIWLPDPDPQQPLLSIKNEVTAFAFESRDGTMIDRTREAQAILAAVPLADFVRNFDRTMTAVIKRLSGLIAEALGADDWLLLEYDPRSTGVRTLWIEHFECLKFELRIRSAYSKEGHQQTLDVHYTPDGTSIIVEDSRVTVPAFNRKQIAKCEPRSVTELCKEIDMRLEISVATPQVLIVDVLVNGSDVPVHFTWEIENCVPVIANGKTATFRPGSGEPDRTIRLCAFTENGCMVVATRVVNLG
ncbi:MAG: hypothetical protein V4857_02730 [Pseudomonadota bacterium]